MTSSSIMFASSTPPPRGIKLSSIALTAPSDEAVATVANNDDIVDAKTNLFALHIAAGLHFGWLLVDTECRECRVTTSFGA